MEPLKSSHADPNGRLFLAGDHLVRGVYSSRASFYEELVKSDVVQSLMGRNRLIWTEVTQETPTSERDFGLFLTHPRIWPISYCSEWSPSMLKEAAKLTLEIALEIDEAGLMLQDASPWNVLYSGAQPVFIDFTSIVPPSPTLPWPAYDQFCRLFLFPLYLAGVGRYDVARHLLFVPTRGVTTEMVKAFRIPRRFQFLKRVLVPALLEKLDRRFRISERLQAAVSGADSKQLGSARRRLLENLLREVSSMEVVPATSHWSPYQTAHIEGATETFSEKVETITRVLRDVRPKSVLDLGCNQGLFCNLAIAEGAKVIGLDSDDSCIDQVFLRAHHEGDEITPLVVDLASPNSGTGWNGCEFLPLSDRVRSHLTLALAVVHHLAITLNKPFCEIFDFLSKLTTDYLVIEFVDRSDEMAALLLKRKDEQYVWYSREKFLAALSEKFTILSTRRLPGSSRDIVVGRRRHGG